MLRIPQLRLPVEHTQRELTERVKKLLRCNETPEISVVRRSVDARKKPKLYFNYILNVRVKNQAQVYRHCNKNQVLLWEEKPYVFPAPFLQSQGTWGPAGQACGKERPVIIGTGPAGLFCGYMLAQAGFCPILLERGMPVEQRVRDVESFWKNGSLNPESNVQFGEGGAGTFSDGKLNTLVKDTHGRNGKVLSVFVEAGAPPEILFDHKPHIGTDVLQKVVVNLRKAIQDMGGEVRFCAKVTDLESEGGQISGLIINGDERLPAKYVVLAPGHSARDTFSMLFQRGIRMEAKPFAVGMRVEHPQELINLSQYGQRQVPALGNAPYKVTAKASDQRGVYSFCMCPGGYVVNASSEPGHLAVNGMSYSKRNGQNANSAIVIAVSPEDYGSNHPLAGVEFQRRLERKAFEAAKGKVPVERYGEYKRAVTGSAGQEEGSLTGADFFPSIKGEWAFAPVHEILPEPLRKAFVEGMESFGRTIRGFNAPDVLVEGVESRTSSPVRIIRDDTLQSSLKGLYPCGEGAGYAGGITSAAMDGIRVAEEIALSIAAGRDKEDGIS
mgnify:FL=1